MKSNQKYEIKRGKIISAREIRLLGCFVASVAVLEHTGAKDLKREEKKKKKRGREKTKQNKKKREGKRRRKKKKKRKKRRKKKKRKMGNNHAAFEIQFNSRLFPLAFAAQKLER